MALRRNSTGILILRKITAQSHIGNICSKYFQYFRDIFQSEARVTVARIYLPSLTIFDRIKIDEKIANEFKSVRKCCNGSINIFEKVIKVYNLPVTYNMTLRRNTYCKMHLGKTHSFHILSIIFKKMNISNKNNISKTL